MCLLVLLTVSDVVPAAVQICFTQETQLFEQAYCKATFLATSGIAGSQPCLQIKVKEGDLWHIYREDPLLHTEMITKWACGEHIYKWNSSHQIQTHFTCSAVCYVQSFTIEAHFMQFSSWMAQPWWGNTTSSVLALRVREWRNSSHMTTQQTCTYVSVRNFALVSYAPRKARAPS